VSIVLLPRTHCVACGFNFATPPEIDELERCQRALLQVRTALGLHRDSNDDLLEVIAKLRATQPPARNADGVSYKEIADEMANRATAAGNAANTMSLAAVPLSTLDRMLAAKGLEKERELCQQAFGYVAHQRLRGAGGAE
jgi:hypothetical protein